MNGGGGEGKGLGEGLVDFEVGSGGIGTVKSK